MKPRVVAIETGRRRHKPKTVPASQAAVERLPLNSGTWRVCGISGLYVRCRAQTKSFFIQRRVRGVLLKRTLGEMTLKAARTAASQEWARLKPQPAAGLSFDEALARYLAEKPLSAKTVEAYNYAAACLGDWWRRRPLGEIGADRAGVRSLYHEIRRCHGEAAASLSVRMLAAVYRHQRRVDGDLPESPTTAVDLPSIKPRDWALSPEELRAWAKAVDRLTPIRWTWWYVALLTGARRGSIEALRWTDVDFERRLVHFSVAKGGRTYTVPAADALIELLAEYRDSGEVPPSAWIFPSTRDSDFHVGPVDDSARGVVSPHHMRHGFRTVLAQVGASPDQARLLMGHAMSGDVSRGYISVPLVLESLRPLANAAAGALLGMLES